MTKAVIFDMYETLITLFECEPYFGPQIAEETGYADAGYFNKLFLNSFAFLGISNVWI